MNSTRWWIKLFNLSFFTLYSFCQSSSLAIISLHFLSLIFFSWQRPPISPPPSSLCFFFLLLFPFCSQRDECFLKCCSRFNEETTGLRTGWIKCEWGGSWVNCVCEVYVYVYLCIRRECKTTIVEAPFTLQWGLIRMVCAREREFFVLSLASSSPLVCMPGSALK